MLQYELIFIKKVRETAGGQTEAEDEEGSGRKALVGRPCAANSHCENRDNCIYLVD